MNDTTHSARRLLVLGLVVTTAVQIGLAQSSYYLDSDDFFVLNMGARVSSDFTDTEHLTRFWSQEPTWRPLMTLNAGVNYAMWGTEASPRGLLIVLLHLWCALLVYSCLLYLCANPMVPAATAVLYSAHPLHAEALVWFHSGHEGVAVSLAILLTVWAFASGRAAWWGLFLFQCALFVRENALCVPLLLMGVALVQHRSIKWAFRLTLPYWVLLLTNIGLRLALIQSEPSLSQGMSFHWVDNPGVAVATTLLHPWLPLHPALEPRVFLAALFLVIAGGVVVAQGRRPFRMAGIAFGGLMICAIPFLPQFHAAHRFFEALPGGIEQRWYFFHLPLASLMVWPAWTLMGSGAPRWGRAFFWGTAAVFLCVQALNASWWSDRCDSAKSVVSELGNALDERPAAIGLMFESNRDDPENADKIFLHFRTLWPEAGRRQVRAFHRRIPDGAVEESIAHEVYGAQWRPLSRPAPTVQWWKWNRLTGTLERSP